MKLKGAVVDRMREVLGGKTPTEKRIKDALAELERLRAKQAVEMSNAVTGSPGVTTAASPGVNIPDVGTASVVPEAFIPPGPDDEEEDDDTPEAAPAQEMPKSERDAMAAAIRNLEQKVLELSKPRTAEDRDLAIGAGRLPTTVAEAPPLGYTGSAQLPRGVWFESPYGPKIQIRLCDCADCTPYRLQHYFCVQCHRGPIDYQQHNPQGRKLWMAPGATWGISHECCTAVCYMRYMESLGVIAGVNEHSPVGQPAGDGPQKPPLLPGSD